MTDRYVHPVLGTDSGLATSRDAGAWHTLQYALSTASATAPGDIIRLQSGNYDEFIEPQKSGTAANPIIIEADAGASPVLRGANGVEGIIDISAGKKYLTFRNGLYFSYGWSAPLGNYRFPWFQIGGVNTSNIIIQNCTFERPGWADHNALALSPWQEYAIQIDSAKNCLVDDCTIRGTQIGIQPKGTCTGGTIQNCDIGHTALSCIVMGDSGGVSRGFAIVNNELHNSVVEDGIQFHQDFGAIDDSIDLSNVGTLVLYNRIHDCGENAIDLKGAQKVVVEGNIMWRMAGSGSGFHPVEGSNTNSMGTVMRGARTSTQDVIIRNNIIYDSSGAMWVFPGYKVYHNTLVYNRRTYAGTNTAAENKAHGVRQQGPAPRVGVKNNIFDNHEYDTQWYTENPQPSNEVSADFNLYASNRWSSINNALVVTSYTTLTAWRAKLAANNWRYGKEQNSLAVPTHAAIGFVNVPASPTGEFNVYDFGITATSPAKAQGGPLTYTVGAGTNAGTMTLQDAGWFSDIFGRTDIHVRDRIFFGGQERTITAVDYVANTVSFTPNASWIDHTDVYYVRAGEVATTTPNIGAQNYSITGAPTPPAPPTPGGPGGRAIGNAALNLVAGNQTIPLATPLSGIPQAWRFTLSLAVADEAAVQGAVIGRGWAWNNSGTIVQGAICLRSNDTTQSTGRRTINDGCGFLTVPGASTIDVQFSFVSGTTNDVTINITNPPNAAYLLTVEAFVCVNAYFGQVAIQTTQDAVTTVTCGFQPNYWNFATANRAIPGSASNVNSSFGLATRTGAVITQQCVAFQSKNVSTPTSVVAQIRNDYIGGLIDDFGTVSPGIQLTAVTATSFGLATRLAAHPETTPGGFVFALQFDQQVYSGIVSAPLTANATLDYPVGFAPGSADIIQTHLPLTNTAELTGAAGALGFGCWDGTSQYCTAIADEDGASLPNTQSQSDNRFINVDTHAGLAGLIAAVVGPSTTNLRLNYSSVIGTAAKGILVAIGQSFVPTLTPNFTGTPLSGVGAVTVVFTNTSTASGTTITSYAWDFGDGFTSAAVNPTHTYSTPGVYTVTLAVSDGAISNIKVRTDYIVIADPSVLGISFTTYVLAGATPPQPAASNVFAIAGVS